MDSQNIQSQELPADPADKVVLEIIGVVREVLREWKEPRLIGLGEVTNLIEHARQVWEQLEELSVPEQIEEWLAQFQHKLKLTIKKE